MSNQSTPPTDSSGQPEGAGAEGLQHVADQRLGQQHDGQEGTAQPRPEDQGDAPANPGSANA